MCYLCPGTPVTHVFLQNIMGRAGNIIKDVIHTVFELKLFLSRQGQNMGRNQDASLHNQRVVRPRPPTG